MAGIEYNGDEPHPADTPVFEMNRYVVGYLFNEKGEVCLIEKKRPEWQKGRLNGVGGHIEDGETPQQAMTREFEEEAGAIANWQQFCFIYGPAYELYCFKSRDNVKVNTMTDEVISWYPVQELPENVLPILKWAIPMADYKFDITASVYHESEEC